MKSWERGEGEKDRKRDRERNREWSLFSVGSIAKIVFVYLCVCVGGDNS